MLQRSDLLSRRGASWRSFIIAVYLNVLHCFEFWSTNLTYYHSIVSQLACLLDLNTLHDLSRTCRQFRANLLQYRTMLTALTLRCANEVPDPTVRSDFEQTSSSVAPVYRTRKTSGRFTSGKVGPCARDMVGECRKCSEIVCRVC